MDEKWWVKYFLPFDAITQNRSALQIKEISVQIKEIFDTLICWLMLLKGEHRRHLTMKLWVKMAERLCQACVEKQYITVSGPRVRTVSEF